MSKNISLAKAIEYQKSSYFIDVREKEEWEAGHIPNAIWWPLSQLMIKKPFQGMNPNKRYIIYCKSGKRAQKACSLLESEGFINLFNLEGGFIQWQLAHTATKFQNKI